MSYEKQTWAKGDIVTSAKLNHMEDGINSQPFIVLVGLYIYDSDEGIIGYRMLTPFADFEQAITDGKTLLLNCVDEDLNNRTLDTYVYAGEIKWEETSYYLFTCPKVSKSKTQPITASIDYIRISTNGNVQSNSIFLTTKE